MSEVSEQYTQAKSTRMSGGSERRRKRNRTKHWLIVAVACFQTNNVSAQNEHPLLSEARGGIGYWRIEGQYKMDFFGDGETERRNRALKKSAKNERESSSTKRSKKSSKSSKKSSSSNSSNDLGELIVDHGSGHENLGSSTRSPNLNLLQ